jgi:hypothetical protein
VADQPRTAAKIEFMLNPLKHGHQQIDAPMMGVG